MQVVWQCESDPFCQSVLRRHWPNVTLYDDIREMRRSWVPEDQAPFIAPVDVLCGGFPCQDISAAGRGEGIGGKRSSLWKEYARLVGELRPRYVIVENVSALAARGLDVVLGDLSALGYDAEWDCIRAADIGAPHLRARLWLVAYPRSERRWKEPGSAPSDEGEPERGTAPADHVVGGLSSGGVPEGPRAFTFPSTVSNPAGTTQRVIQPLEVSDWWRAEPSVGRVADGVPNRLAQLRCLGNALVPQIAEYIGRQIVAYELSATVGDN